MVKGVLLDLDGTVYYGPREVPGAAAFVRRLEDRGVAYLFVTNRANRTPGEICGHLQEYGIACTQEHILTSAQATAEHLGSGSVYYVGEEGLRLALQEVGLAITEASPDAVVVSFDRGFTYDKLERACRLIDAGARFIATNPDKALKMENGLAPGTGAIVAAVAAGCGQEPVVIGKPEPLIFEIALRRLGLAGEDVIAVGDNVDTDIEAGHAAGIRTALLLTGVSTREDLPRASAPPTWVAANFEELEKALHGELPG